MAEFADEGPPVLCTFAVGEKSLIPQPIYICNTCNNLDQQRANRCCCVGCAKSCHKDHDVAYMAFGRAYCDCGADTCSLMRYSLPIAQNVRRSMKNKLLTFDESGHIGGTSNTGLVTVEFQEKVINGIHNWQIYAQDCAALVEHSKDTFWIGAAEQPRCLLEAFAKNVFQHHVANSTYDVSISGAEWWVQVKSCDDEDSMKTGKTIFSLYFLFCEGHLLIFLLQV